MAGRFQIVGVPVRFKTVATTMSGDETFVNNDGNVFFKDPGGASRNLNPSGTFIAGAWAYVVNTADVAEDIVFDSSGVNQTVGQNESAIFAYDGSSWRVVWLGQTDLTADASVTFDTVLVSETLRGVTSRWYACKQLDAIEASPGASGATFMPPDANTVGGYRFDANTEYLYIGSRPCSRWDGASDLQIMVWFEVNVDNTGGADTDTVDLQLLCYYKSVGDTSCKTQTLEESVVVGKSAQYKHFSVIFTIDHDAGGNEVTIRDIMSFRINLETDTSEVDDVIINYFMFHYECAKVQMEIAEAP